MNRVKLLQNPLPVDRVARRVTRKAKPEDLWRPMPKGATEAYGAVLATAPVPWLSLNGNPELRTLPGRRRGYLTIIGYAADQGSDKKNSRWVVRCDCGNYEYRRRILRWIGTEAPDMCHECLLRTYKKQGEWANREPARRATKP